MPSEPTVDVHVPPPDTRPRATPTAPVNLAQLDRELGDVGVARNEETGEVVAPTAVTQEQLDAAVAAHVPIDPEPDPQTARFASLEVRAAALEAAMNVTPSWEPGIAVDVGQKWQHDGTVYVVTQAHTTQAGWEPAVVPALFDPVA